jgi:hypothetical protein
MKTYTLSNSYYELFTASSAMEKDLLDVIRNDEFVESNPDSAIANTNKLLFRRCLIESASAMQIIIENLITDLENDLEISK